MSDTKHVLEMERTLDATPERVFQAWTDPNDLKNWFAPSPEVKNPIIEIDLKVGGRYRIVMEAPDGNRYDVRGEFKEIDRPNKLVYTWGWEHEPDVAATLVTVELRPADGGGTHMTLKHERFADEEAKTKHEEGWTGCLARLGPALS